MNYKTIMVVLLIMTLCVVGLTITESTTKEVIHPAGPMIGDEVIHPYGIAEVDMPMEEII